MRELSPKESVDRLARLSECDRRVLSVMAVANEPLDRTNLAALLQAANIANERGRTISTAALLPRLEQWRGLSLVTSDGDSSYRLRVAVAHALMTKLSPTALRELARSIRAQRPVRMHYRPSHDTGALAREFWLSLYLKEKNPDFDDACTHYLDYTGNFPEGLLWRKAIGTEPPDGVLRAMPAAGQQAYLSKLIEHAVKHLAPVGTAVRKLALESRAKLDASAAADLCVFTVLTGAAEQGLAATADSNTPEVCAARAFAQMSLGRNEQARAEAQRALEFTAAKSSGRMRGLKGALSRWVTLLLVSGESRRGHELARMQLATKWAWSADLQLSLLAHALDASRNGAVETKHKTLSLEMAERYGMPHDWAGLLAWRLFRGLREQKLLKEEVAQLKLHAAEARAAGYSWLDDELRRLAAGQESHLTQLARARPPWERVVLGLESVLEKLEKTGPAASAERLVWSLVVRDSSHQVSARIQVQTNSGYSSGRQVSWKTLAETTQAPWLTADDARLIKSIRLELPDSRLGGGGYTLGGDAPLLLVGHPNVFADYECKQPLTVVRGTPRVEIESQGSELQVSMVPEGLTRDGLLCVREAEDRVVVYGLSDSQAMLARLLDKRLTLPAEARERSQALLSRIIQHFPVASDVELTTVGGSFEELQGDPRPCVDLRPLSAGLSVRIQVVPAGEGQAFLPGEGPASVFAKLERAEGQVTVRCLRDLEQEREQVTRLFAACPQLEGGDTAHSLAVPTRVECLELLLALSTLGEAVRVRWPEGKPVAVLGERGSSSMRMRLTSQMDWLSPEGELTVDPTTMLTLQELLGRFSQRQGRFIELEGGQFVALTTELERKLEAIAATSEERAGKLVLHPLVADVLFAPEEFHSLDVDKTVKQRLAKLAEAQTHVPKLPSGFEAELRPYQRDGFTWLTRLSMWGAGACLADDMGLGKTLQTLALLLAQAPRGPALVVAPMSVCENWRTEAKRFAPALNVRMLANEDRAAVLDSAEPFDVIVMSYGILQQEIDRLAKVTFQVIVLDEAQAIKNAQTRRARAAFRLVGVHKVALTGTPVENQLGELWSLFAFLNPGLLGTAKAFDARFARPIQRDGNERAARSLRRLLKPFVLRRKKSEVLEDLPPKTEITLRVEPSPEELALYEALREQALSRLADPAQSNQQRLRVLAEIMKLRRAACNPQLVAPELGLTSQKLETFEALVAELEKGGHRALVFSQFVDHLALVRARLDTLGIPYQYLDGSSTAAQRADAVGSFQKGAGRLFLISLKAGGFGLNLTAADYVVHLDPWWNPAVEDQASDRAHRIGQTRPVTVYRLVMRGSIEEKILRLHHDKRELSDSLLDGTSRGGALNVEELMALLHEEHPVEAARGRRGSQSKRSQARA